MTRPTDLRTAHVSGVHAVERELAAMHRALLRPWGYLGPAPRARDPWRASVGDPAEDAAEDAAGDAAEDAADDAAGDAADDQEAGGDWADQERVVRLAVLTLVAVCRSDADAQLAAAVVDSIAAHHPARALVVVADAREAPGVEAELRLSCSETGDRICAEIARLHVGGDPARRLVSVLAPLLLPDVPVHLWLVGAAGLERALAADTLPLLEGLILDSDAHGDPRAVLSRLAGVAGRPRSGSPVLICDLAWARLAPVRDAIARAFDPPEVRPFLRGVDHVEIEVEGGRPCSDALLLHGWIVSRLGRAGLPTPELRVVDGVAGTPSRPATGRDAPEAEMAEPSAVEVPPAPGPGPARSRVRCVRLGAVRGQDRATLEVTREKGVLRARITVARGSAAATASARGSAAATASPTSAARNALPEGMARERVLAIREVPAEEPSLAELVDAALESTSPDVVFEAALGVVAAR